MYWPAPGRPSGSPGVGQFAFARQGPDEARAALSSPRAEAEDVKMDALPESDSSSHPKAAVALYLFENSRSG